MLDLKTAWPLYTGMLVAGAAAVVASASTLAGLAEAAGWQGRTPWLLPAAVDVGGCAGGWCWLRPTTPGPARRFGRTIALTGAATSLIGNATGHLTTTGYLTPGPALVVIVGAVPAAVLVALAHLAALLTQTPLIEDDASSPPSPTPADPLPDQAKEPTRDAVLALLREHPHTVAELAAATGRSRSTITGHLNALTEAGAAQRDDEKRYFAVPHEET